MKTIIIQVKKKLISFTC